MKIVIDIDENSYKATRSGSMLPPDVKNAVNAIKNGIVLPKGHGDLIDRDILLQNWEVIPSRDRLVFDRYIQTLDGVIPADK